MLLLSAEPAAHAEGESPSAKVGTSQDQQRAEELYKEGAQLLGEGRYWEAESRFQESLKLLKGRGTLLNLAICHENLGRLATAYKELKSLEEQALAMGDTSRLEVAREHLAWIEPQLSYLSVSLPVESQLPGIQVELDGQAISAFGVMLPVDPGRHQLRAIAPGKKDYSLDLTFETGDQPRTITIPRLVDVDVVTVIAPAHPDNTPPRRPLPPVPESPPKADYRNVYIAGATTLTLTAGAIASAFLYYDRRAAYHDAVSNPNSVSEGEASARRQSAEQMAWINGTLIVGAGIGAAVTGFLWYRASQVSQVRIAEGAWVAPLMVGSGAGLRAGARF